jgi:RNA polymerase sigma-70 factor (ECF subfamily)
LAKSAHGDRFSRYHALAAIAAEHGLAPSFSETCWDRIVECYSLLEQVSPSPINKLNQAVAVAEWQGPESGLAALDGFEPPTWLAGSYLYAPSWPICIGDAEMRVRRSVIARSRSS